MSSRRKLFRVTFADTRDMRIDLKARSWREAIRIAERLYLESDPLDERFVRVCGDVFHDSDAEEVQS